jgi:hypothetical protein
MKPRSWVKWTSSNEWMCHKCGSELHEVVDVSFEVSTEDEPKPIPSDQTFIVLSASLLSSVSSGDRAVLAVTVGDRPKLWVPVRLLMRASYEVQCPLVVPPRTNISLTAFSSAKIGAGSKKSKESYTVFLSGLIRRDVA